MKRQVYVLNNLMRHTIYSNKQGALKTPILDTAFNKCFVLLKVLSVTQDCRIIGIENICLLVFVRSNCSDKK